MQSKNLLDFLTRLEDRFEDKPQRALLTDFWWLRRALEDIRDGYPPTPKPR
jgi:hypothetical protein